MKPILCLLLSFYTLLSFSQSSSISILITDSTNNNPIEFANCIFTNLSSKATTAYISDAKGKIEIKNMAYGNYQLTLKLIGYNSVEIDSLIVNQPIIVLKKQLTTSDATLGEVKIIEKRNAIVFDGDKTIVNVGSDIGNDGGNIKDVIQNAPGISIDNNNVISLLGKEGVKVLINGKETNRTKNMKAFLENLKASMIDKIEIMTNPPARYSAEGTAGIINIILKKGVDEFLYGSISAKTDRFGSSGLALELGHSNEHFSIDGSLNADYYAGNGFSYSLLTNNSADTSYSQRSKQISNWKGPGLSPNLNFDYYINENNTLSATLGYESFWNNGKTTEFDTLFDATNIQTLLVSRNIKDKSFYHGFNSSLNYEKLLKNEDENINISISFENSKDEENNDYSDNAIGINPYYKIRKHYSNEQSMNIDSRIELNKNIDSNWTFNGGYQYTYDYIKNYAAINQDINLNNDYKLVNENNFLFNQHINSLYTTFIGKYGKFKLNTGVRFEHTLNNGMSNTKSIKNQYYGFYPNLSISIKMNSSNSISLSYNRRLVRPWVFMLQENIFSTNDRNVWSGNSSLKPAISNNYNLTYNYNLKKWTINFVLGYKEIYNDIAWSQIKIVNGVRYQGFGNFGESKNIGTYLFVNYKPFKSWDITGSITTGVNIINKSSSVYISSKRNYYIYTSLKNQWKIKKHVVVLSDMWYSPKTKTSTGVNQPVFYFDLALKLLFMHSKLGITLSGENILNTGNWSSSFIGADYSSSNSWFYNRPNVQLTIIYHFGKDKKEDDTIIKSENKGGNGDMGGN